MAGLYIAGGALAIGVAGGSLLQAGMRLMSFPILLRIGIEVALMAVGFMKIKSLEGGVPSADGYRGVILYGGIFLTGLLAMIGGAFIEALYLPWYMAFPLIGAVWFAVDRYHKRARLR